MQYSESCGDFNAVEWVLTVKSFVLQTLKLESEQKLSVKIRHSWWRPTGSLTATDRKISREKLSCNSFQKSPQNCAITHQDCPLRKSPSFFWSLNWHCVLYKEIYKTKSVLAWLSCPVSASMATLPEVIISFQQLVTQFTWKRSYMTVNEPLCSGLQLWELLIEQHPAGDGLSCD